MKLTKLKPLKEGDAIYALKGSEIECWVIVKMERKPINTILHHIGPNGDLYPSGMLNITDMSMPPELTCHHTYTYNPFRSSVVDYHEIHEEKTFKEYSIPFDRWHRSMEDAVSELFLRIKKAAECGRKQHHNGARKFKAAMKALANMKHTSQKDAELPPPLEDWCQDD